MPVASHRPSRRRASHSLEAVVTEAIAILDEAGEPALTFRALAARLGGGVASIYWYVANKDELLARVSDHVLADVLSETEELTGSEDPIDDLRAIAITFFDMLIRRPWLAAYFMRNTGVQLNGLRLVERLGQQVLRLGLTPQQSLPAVSAVLGFVLGIAADSGQQQRSEQVVADGSAGELLSDATEQWRALDPEEFPFVHYVVEEFAVHDDREQFLAGLDLLLSGLRHQAAETAGGST